MTKLNSRDVRKAKIIEMACEGIPIGTIAQKNDCGISTVERAIRSVEGQERLQNVINDCETHINSRLPTLLEFSLNQLENILKPDSWADKQLKIRASEIILKTALKLSQISSRA